MLDLVSDVFFVIFAMAVADLRPYAYAAIALLLVRSSFSVVCPDLSVHIQIPFCVNLLVLGRGLVNQFSRTDFASW